MNDFFGTSYLSNGDNEIGAFDHQATASLAISGEPLEGNTLSASLSNLVDPDGPASPSFQWQRLSSSGQWNNISSANSSSFQIPDDQSLVGSSLRLHVISTDSRGGQTSFFSDPLVVQNSNDSPQHNISILGNAVEGQTLSIDLSSLVDQDGIPSSGIHSPSIQWLRNNTPIDGANSNSYSLSQNDVDSIISAQISYRDNFGNNESFTLSNPSTVLDFDHQATASLAISGEPLEGNTLSASLSNLVDPDGPASPSFQWQRLSSSGQWNNISSANSSSFQIPDDQSLVGSSLRLHVISTDSRGGQTSFFSDPLVVQNSNDSPQHNISILGNAVEGQTLSIDLSSLVDQDGIPSSGIHSPSIQWLRNNTPIDGANSNSYSLSQNDVDSIISAQISYRDNFGNNESFTLSNPSTVLDFDHQATASLAISGEPLEGNTLSASLSNLVDPDGPASPSFQWQRLSSSGQWNNISSANSSSFQIPDDQSLVGSSLRLHVISTDSRGGQTSFFSDPLVVQNSNDSPQHNISILGNAVEGQTLSIDLSSLVDQDGIPSSGIHSPSIQWLRNNTPIDGANSNSYSLSQNDVDSIISAQISYRDNFGNNESFTLSNPSTVLDFDHQATASLAISGEPLEGNTLSASLSNLVDPDGPASPSFQWQRLSSSGQWNNISSANSSSFQIPDDQSLVGSSLRLHVISTDSRGGQTSFFSDPLVVQNSNDSPQHNISILGNAVEGQTLSIDLSSLVDQDGIPSSGIHSPSIQWLRNNTPIDGANSNSYSLSQNDVDSIISAQISYRDNFGNNESFTLSNPSTVLDFDHQATASLAISGEPLEGNTLSASLSNLVDPDGPASPSFQWQRLSSSGQWNNISSANSSSFQIPDDQSLVGSSLRLHVISTDSRGGQTSFFSDPLVVQNSNDSPQHNISILGNAVEGQTLSIDLSSLVDQDGIPSSGIHSPSIQWLRNNTPIDGANSNSYSLSQNDVDSIISAQISYRDNFGNNESFTLSNPSTVLDFDHQATASLAISGEPLEGNTLSASLSNLVDPDGPASPSFQWQRLSSSGQWNNISSANSSSFQIPDDQSLVGSSLRLHVISTDSRGGQTSFFSDPLVVQNSNDSPQHNISILGNAVEGQTLSIDLSSLVDQDGIPSSGIHSPSIQWLRNNTPIDGANSNSYSLSQNDVDSIISAQISYRDNFGNNESFTLSNPSTVLDFDHQATASLAISGEPLEGNTLSASLSNLVDPDGPASPSFQWQRLSSSGQWNNISSANSSSFQIPDDQSLVGSSLRLHVISTDSRGGQTSFFSDPLVVQNSNDSPQHNISILGNAVEGQTLSIDLSSLVDQDGIPSSGIHSPSIQWLRNNTPIDGANSNSYSLSQNDVDSIISAQISYRDNFGNNESFTLSNPSTVLDFDHQATADTRDNITASTDEPSPDISQWEADGLFQGTVRGTVYIESLNSTAVVSHLEEIAHLETTRSLVREGRSLVIKEVTTKSTIQEEAFLVTYIRDGEVFGNPNINATEISDRSVLESIESSLNIDLDGDGRIPQQRIQDHQATASLAISGEPLEGNTLSASLSNLVDPDGPASPSFQWQRLSSSGQWNNISSANSSSFQIPDDQSLVGSSLRLHVISTDSRGGQTSFFSDPLVVQNSNDSPQHNISILGNAVEGQTLSIDLSSLVDQDGIPSSGIHSPSIQWLRNNTPIDGANSNSYSLSQNDVDSIISAQISYRDNFGNNESFTLSNPSTVLDFDHQATASLAISGEPLEGNTLSASLSNLVDPDGPASPSFQWQRLSSSGQWNNISSANSSSFQIPDDQSLVGSSLRLHVISTDSRGGQTSFFSDPLVVQNSNDSPQHNISILGNAVEGQTLSIDLSSLVDQDGIPSSGIHSPSIQWLRNNTPIDGANSNSYSLSQNDVDSIISAQISYRDNFGNNESFTLSNPSTVLDFDHQATASLAISGEPLEGNTLSASLSNLVDPDGPASPSFQWQRLSSSGQWNNISSANSSSFQIPDDQSLVGSSLRLHVISTDSRGGQTSFFSDPLVVQNSNDSPQHNISILGNAVEGQTLSIDLSSLVDQDGIPSSGIHSPSIQWLRNNTPIDGANSNSYSLSQNDVDSIISAQISYRDNFGNNESFTLSNPSTVLDFDHQATASLAISGEPLEGNTLSASLSNLVDPDGPASPSFQWQRLSSSGQWNNISSANSSSFQIPDDQSLVGSSLRLHVISTDSRGGQTSFFSDPLVVQNSNDSPQHNISILGNAVEGQTLSIDLSSLVDQDGIPSSGIHSPSIQWLRNNTPIDGANSNSYSLSQNDVDSIISAQISYRDNFGNNESFTLSNPSTVLDFDHQATASLAISGEPLEGNTLSASLSNLVDPDGPASPSFQWQRLSSSGQWNNISSANSSSFQIPDDQSLVGSSLRLHVISTDSRGGQTSFFSDPLVVQNSNDSPQHNISILGNAVEGQTLSIDLSSLVDQDGIPSSGIHSPSIQWLRNNTPIDGANSNSYSLSQNDVDSIISAQISYRDNFGNNESFTLSNPSTVLDFDHQATASLAISGEPLEGNTLSASLSNLVDPDGPASPSFQWQRLSSSGQWNNISSANSSSFQIPDDQSLVGSSLRLHVISTDSRGGQTSFFSDPLVVQNSNDSPQHNISILGNAVEGQTLSIDLSSLVDQDGIPSSGIHSPSIQWLRNNTPIDGANSNSYSLSQNDVDSIISAQISYRDNFGNNESFTLSNPSTVLDFDHQATADTRDNITASTDEPSPDISQWEADGLFQGTVRGTVYIESLNSTAVVSHLEEIAHLETTRSLVREGRSLVIKEVTTKSTIQEEAFLVTYIRDGEVFGNPNINATEISDRSVLESIESSLNIDLDGDGRIPQQRIQDHQATASLAISGEPLEGNTLSASLSNLVDPDGPASPSFQWQRLSSSGQWNNISSANSSSFQIPDDQSLVGSSLRLHVISTDSRGGQTSFFSDPLVVQNSNDSPQHNISILGNAVEGQTLSIDLSSLVDQDGIPSSGIHSPSIQWLRNNTPIDGANSNSYSLSQNDVDSIISAQISYRDNFGNNESFTLSNPSTVLDFDHQATASLAISGEPLEGNTLSASLSNLVDPDGPASPSFQWQRLSSSGQWNNISSANSSSFQIPDDQSLVGSSLRLHVISTDSRGGQTSFFSDPLVVQNSNDSPQHNISILGNAVEGQTLSIDLSSLVDQDGIPSSGIHSPSIQWLRNNTPIDGANSNSYSLSQNDVDSIISAQISYRDNFGNNESFTLSNPSTVLDFDHQATASLAISGEPLEGNTLSASLSNLVDPDGPASPSFQWQRLSSSGQWNNISSANSSSFQIPDDQSLVGSSLRLHVISTDSRGGQTSFFSDPLVVQNSNDSPQHNISILGNAVEGQTLSIDLSSLVDQDGIPSSGIHSPSIQWLRNNTPIDGANSNSYSLSQNDVDSIISAQISYRDNFGNNESFTLSNPSTVLDFDHQATASLAISGEPLEGNTLSASLSNLVDPDGPASPSFQWQRLSSSGQWNNISSANSSSFQIPDDQSLVGSSLRLHVISTDSRGGQTSFFSDPLVVQNSNDSPQHNISILGNAVEGQTLSIDLSSLVDQDGIPSSGIHSPSIQWLRNNTPIDGANSNSYSLSQNDVDSIISAQISYRDNFGNNESFTLSNPSTVLDFDHQATASLAISGEPLEGNTLSASLSNLVDPDGPASPSFQWQRLSSSGQWNNISSANSSSFQIPDDQSLVGSSLRLHVISTDSRGGQTSFFSDPLVVQNSNDSPQHNISILGNAVEGQTLSIDLSSLVDQDGIPSSGIHSPSIQWLRNNTPIDGANSNSYSLSQNDVDSIISAQISYRDNFGNNESFTLSNPSTVLDFDHQATASLAISGEPLEGNTLSASLSNLVDPDGPASPSFQWQRLSSSGQWNNISSANSSSFQIPDDQSLVGSSLRLHVISTDSRGGQTSFFSDPLVVQNSNDSPQHNISILGNAVEGQTLSIDLSSLVDQDGIPSSGIHSPSIQWLRNNTPIDGANSNSYSLSQNDVDSIISAQISYRDNFGNNESFTLSNPSTVLDFDHQATASLAISGEPLEGNTLSASLSNLVDPDGPASPSFQWQRLSSSGQWNNISSANSSSFQIPDDQSLVGSSLRLHVISTDSRGGQTSFFSDPLVVQNSNDSPQHNISILGNAVEGQTLSIDLSSLVDQDGIPSSGIHSPSIQWLRNNTPIDGANSNSYSLSQNDVDSIISAQISYRDNFGNNESFTLSNPSTVLDFDHQATASLAISGEPLEGNTLSASLSNLVDPDGPASPSFQWQRLSSSGQWNNISSANSSSFQIPDDQSLVGSSLRLHVISTDSRGGQTSFFSDPLVVQNSNDSPQHNISILGNAVEGQTLSIDLSSLVDQDGIPSSGIHSPSIQWLRNNTPIDGANSNSYSLSQNDVDSIISAQISYRDNFGNNESFTLSNPSTVLDFDHQATASLAISGEPLEGNTLSASLSNLVDPDGPASPSFQWQRLSSSGQWNNISSANSSSFQIPDDQSLVGSSLRLHVISTDSRGGQTSFFSDPLVVQNSNDSPQHNISILGNAVEGQTLSIDLSSLVDQDGIPSSGIHSPSIQWLRNNTPIDGANSNSYSLSQNDVDSIISAQVSYIDLNGTSELFRLYSTNKVLSKEVDINGDVTLNISGDDRFVINDSIELRQGQQYISPLQSLAAGWTATTAIKSTYDDHFLVAWRSNLEENLLYRFNQYGERMWSSSILNDQDIEDYEGYFNRDLNKNGVIAEDLEIIENMGESSLLNGSSGFYINTPEVRLSNISEASLALYQPFGVEMSAEGDYYDILFGNPEREQVAILTVDLSGRAISSTGFLDAEEVEKKEEFFKQDINRDGKIVITHNGSDASESFYGTRWDDVFTASGGSDDYFNTEGYDTIDYREFEQSISLTKDWKIVKGGTNTDRFIGGIESISGNILFDNIIDFRGSTDSTIVYDDKLGRLSIVNLAEGSSSSISVLGFNTVYGSRGGDTITSNGDLTINTGAGNDLVNAADGDKIDAGDGDDTLVLKGSLEDYTFEANNLIVNNSTERRINAIGFEKVIFTDSNLAMPWPSNIYKDEAGNTHGDGLALEIQGSEVTEYLGPLDTIDFFKIRVDSFGDVLVRLGGYSADLQVTIFDADKEKINTLTFNDEDLDEEARLGALNAGDYFISVELIDKRLSTTYKLALSIEETSDIVPDNASTKNPVEVETELRGTLDYLGDRDWYKVEFSENQTYKISLNGITLEDPYLRLRDSQGQLISYNDDIQLGVVRDSRLYYTSSITDEYFIDIGSFDDSFVGEYSLLIDTIDDDITNFPEDAIDLTYRNNAEGRIDWNGDRDMFKLAVSTGKSYEIRLNGISLEDPHLYLVDKDGEVLTSNDNSWATSTKDSRLVIEAESDQVVYFAASSHDDMFEGEYSISYSVLENDINASKSTDRYLEEGGKDHSSLSFINDKDWFKVHLEEGNGYEFWMNGLSLEDPYMYLYDKNGAWIASNDDIVLGRERDSKFIYRALYSGEYYLEANSWENRFTGDYEIGYSSVIDDSGQTPDSARNLNVDNSINGNLESLGDSDWFNVQLREGYTYDFSSNGITCEDTYLYLRAEDGRLLSQNDDILLGQLRDSQFSYTAEYSGDYYIEVRSWDNRYTGTYNLAVKDISLLSDAEANPASNSNQVSFSIVDNFSTVDGYGTVNAEYASEFLTGISLDTRANLAGNHWNLDLLGAPSVWAGSENLNGSSGKDIVVAVIDTGVDLDHPEFSGRLVEGFDFVDMDDSPDDLNGHGTHVAGIIAGADDGQGVWGVAPSSLIMPIRVLDENGAGINTDIASGIRWATDHGADVINLSLAGGGSTEIFSAVKYAHEQNVVIVMGSGNNGFDSPLKPAAYASDYGIAVGAIDRNKEFASWSNKAGETTINYVTAPGVEIYSSYKDSSYEVWSGTSMATPHVAGLAALLLGLDSDLTNEQVEDVITATSSNRIGIDSITGMPML
ncbi:S8 family serine peptidase [Synechococcus sp. LTW-R]|uniref:S8 family serine peptidase n=1 Tax=Synechococcus sp. LTW-R TaxID=2751170 RepID=UPI0016237C02|nr:S8 family serine peptidase [Synechococcus sp. LTW-R]QNG29588.1 S8 family serine peptidase [Synechococcus sp. LTW-R]